MKRLASSLLILAMAVCALQADDLLTTAERSGFTATSTNADVLNFCKALAAKSPMVHFTTIGRSASGNPIPLMIIGDPAPRTPADLINSDRMPIYIQANIHGGEVEGKEATMMLARDIVEGKYPGLPGKLVLLIVPNYNTDGNEQISPDNRYYQGGPEKGVGQRTNGMNLDLNRDWMKLESSEARSVTKLLNEWDPVLLVDCHTTDGSLHLEPMTWTPQLHPSGDAAMIDYAWDVLISDAAKTLKDDFGYDSIPYGNLYSPEEGGERNWYTFGHEPRYTTNYIGIRNRLGVLLETYAYAQFDVRVKSTYGILLGMLKVCDRDQEKITGMVTAADAAAFARAKNLDAEKDVLAVAVDLQARPEPFTVQTWESMERFVDENGRRNIRPVGERVDLEVKNFAKFVPTKSVPLPHYYALDSSNSAIIEKLQQHGIVVEKLLEDADATAMVFNISELGEPGRLYQGHRATSVTGTWGEQQVHLSAGTYLVSTAQPLGMLAASLLEPESDDGLTVWNYFDSAIVGSWGRGTRPHPVMKLMTPTAMQTKLLDR